jgi:hypothetical protein
MTQSIAALYIGEGAYWQGIPARDLTDDEWQALPADTRKLLLDLGLYQADLVKRAVAFDAGRITKERFASDDNQINSARAVEPAAEQQE